MKYLIFALMITFGVYILFYECDEKNSFETKLSEAIIEPASQISDYTDFKWDTAYIAKPYVPVMGFDKFKFPDYVQKEINMITKTDYECILIFTNKGKFVKYEKVRRGIFDFLHHSDVITSSAKLLL